MKIKIEEALELARLSGKNVSKVGEYQLGYQKMENVYVDLV